MKEAGQSAAEPGPRYLPVQPIRPAATVMLLRDHGQSFEVLMMKRTAKAAFAGGMYVFPGGRVDNDDHLQRYARISRLPGEKQAPQTRAVGDEYLGYWIAAVRECFEEAGILLAYDESGDLLVIDDDDPQWPSHREALNSGERALFEICEDAGVTLALDRIHFFNRFVTPEGRPRRFDTRFFIAWAPDQSEMHDAIEVVDSVWINPGEALERNQAGEFDLMRVTQMQLRTLQDFGSARGAVEAAERAERFTVNRPVIPASEFIR